MINERKTFYVKTAAGSDSPIEMHPDWNYWEADTNIMRQQNSQNGALSSYLILGTATRYSLPLNFILEEQKQIFNDWWSKRTELDLLINSSSDLVGLDFTDKVRISNLARPFSVLVTGRSDLYNGVLNFLTI